MKQQFNPEEPSEANETPTLQSPPTPELLADERPLDEIVLGYLLKYEEEKEGAQGGGVGSS